MYLHIWWNLLQPFRELGIQIQQSRVGAPVLLLPYFCVGIVERADITDYSGQVCKISRNLIVRVICTWGTVVYSQIYSVSVDT
jgi:hypothetical protein